MQSSSMINIVWLSIWSIFDADVHGCAQICTPYMYMDQTRKWPDHAVLVYTDDPVIRPFLAHVTKQVEVA